MVIYVCNLCGYEYKAEEGCPDSGIEPGVDFEDLPEDWCCPLCGAGKEEFEETEVADAEQDQEDIY
jgi:rubredoxin